MYYEVVCHFHVFFLVEHSDMHSICLSSSQGVIQLLRGQDERGRGSQISVFVHAQDIKTVHAGGGGKGSNNGKILST